MASTTPRRFLILLVLVLFFAAGNGIGGSLADQTKDEVVIEGRDEQPSRSSFEYDPGSDTSTYSTLGTKDAPRPSEVSPFEAPRLDRDSVPLDHGKLRPSRATAVDEFSTTELMLIGMGLIAVLAVM